LAADIEYVLGLANDGLTTQMFATATQDANVLPHGDCQTALIDYDDFLQSYWPHFSQGLTKGMSEFGH
jgi:hypothetical protein